MGVFVGSPEETMQILKDLEPHKRELGLESDKYFPQVFEIKFCLDFALQIDDLFENYDLSLSAFRN